MADLEEFHWEWESLSQSDITMRVHHITMHFLTMRLTMVTLGVLGTPFLLWEHMWLEAAGCFIGSLFFGLGIPVFLWPWCMKRWNLEPDRWAWELTEIAKRDGTDFSDLKDRDTREAFVWCANNHANRLEVDELIRKSEELLEQSRENREKIEKEWLKL